MSNAFKCDLCHNYYEEHTFDIENIKIIIEEMKSENGFIYKLSEKDLCPECYEKLKEFLRNENVENKTSEEVNTDVKEISYEEARKILESEWCCKCRSYINGKCDRRLSKGIKNCIDCILENKIPVHFDRKFEPEKVVEDDLLD